MLDYFKTPSYIKKGKKNSKPDRETSWKEVDALLKELGLEPFDAYQSGASRPALRGGGTYGMPRQPMPSFKPPGIDFGDYMNGIKGGAPMYGGMSPGGSLYGGGQQFGLSVSYTGANGMNYTFSASGPDANKEEAVMGTLKALYGALMADGGKKGKN